MEKRHTITVTSQQKRALAVATVIALVFGVFFLRHYFTLIIFAAIVAYMFNPLYQKLLQRWGQPGRASAVTFIFSLLVIIIPILLVLVITVAQVNRLAVDVKQSVPTIDVTAYGQDIMNTVNKSLDSLHIPFQLDSGWLTNLLTKALSTIGSSLVKTLTSSLGSFFSFFSTAIIYIFVFLSILKNQKKIMDTIRHLNPLGKDIGELYITKLAAMTKAMVKGQFIIAFLQGLTDALLLYLAGLHSTFFFFLVLLTALSIIPLGGGIIAIPIGIVMMFTGNVWGGVLVVAGHILIVTNIDNVLRPKLVPSEARLDSALTLLAVFAGLGLFGFLGIVIGPVIMILIVTTIRVYLEVFRNVLPEEEDEKGPKGIIHRTYSRAKKVFRKPTVTVSEES